MTTVRFRKLKEPKTAATLSPVERAQLADAAHHLDGEEHPDLDLFIRDGDAFPEYFAVFEGERHVFDAWLFSSDDGSFYEKRSAKRAPYRVIQGRVEQDGAHAPSALQEELQAAYDRRYTQR
jgi:hypothetical protein